MDCQWGAVADQDAPQARACCRASSVGRLVLEPVKAAEMHLCADHVTDDARQVTLLPRTKCSSVVGEVRF